ncbi:MAG: DNA-processing protein DprA [Planctomycetota bacterium]
MSSKPLDRMLQLRLSALDCCTAMLGPVGRASDDRARVEAAPDLVSAVMAADSEEVRMRVFKQVKRLEDLGAKLCWPTGRRLDESELVYPELLRASPAKPQLLWVWGELSEDDRYAVAILGTAGASKYGLAQASRFAVAAARHGLTVVTGGEVGVDHAATRAALDAGGRVIVALGAGLEAHGRPHHRLYQKVVQSGRGVVVSVSPLDTGPTPMNQIDGDYLIAGLSIAALLVEAGPGSGALTAARVVRQEVGRHLMALPGPIDAPTSEGANRLIAEGLADLTQSTEAMLETVARRARASSTTRCQPVRRPDGSC